MNDLWAWAWDDFDIRDFTGILARSLAHVGAYDGERLIGFVNVAWDGGLHAFLLDTSVHPKFRKQGIATDLVKQAEMLARERGAHWLHVDFEAHLTGFYRACGFQLTGAGLIKLQP
ncbi:GNAT family N-acetyltransferase [Phyllobacterium sp. 628]|uniref:GNAT family N-acetyltransferase n=1 Tax=Phyllobacterium sp. 628 TaxID=2718938 RepID=UPI0016625DE1|nr:GNAT family N-acetyltransferase [Phyllobacterium sp. 628]QND54076.1 GNAT family N-acetyltransferase [Phyllobacterium sp. 628]